ncbi:DUF4334 domain-containing protein [Mycobacterium sp. ITM-2016-00318]|uniref:DUF4334 domain-containing protein n=1 Tax=Mycobacterium sp. ITM-2016-00318 TaxID=2099693 RepID=UPI001E5BC98F|nr:DUF4334 domain-containing protein [Mycobacterium sp. ITM-2016-00318]WNG92654.1 DUF4334 domain-containing protein [Mycobacterium sp. ITM-2016-00318]
MIGEWRASDLPTGHRSDGFLGDSYDAMPIHDHFKRIDDDAVLAIMNGKAALDNGRHMYFFLERL